MSTPKWPHVKDNLMAIEMWARDGLTEKQMYTNLGVGKTTWEGFKNKYPELMSALKKGKAPLIAEIQNALVKRALGFTVTETKKYVRIEDGKEVKYQETAEKYFAPDVAACSILLKNKDKDENGKSKWSDNPGKLELEREALELRKRVEELKLF
jgi:hypothetical protein